MKDSPLAVADRHQHGFIATCTAVCRTGVSRAQYCHVLAGSTKRCVQLVALMHPGLSQSVRNRMILADRNQELRPLSVAPGPARCGVRYQLAVLVVPERSGCSTSV